MKTLVARNEDSNRNWHLINADGKTLGRLATEVANLLRGKHKAIYTPYIDTGDFVIVVNARKIKITGKKEQQKVYYRYSGYPGGMTEISYKKMLTKFPTRIIREAVRGMVPHNKLGKAMLKKLKVYSGSEHTHLAQQPKALEI